MYFSCISTYSNPISVCSYARTFYPICLSSHAWAHFSLLIPSPMAIDNPLSFMNSVNQELQKMTPQMLRLNHWPYLILLALLKHPYWRRHWQFGGQIPCHTLALPLVLVSTVLFDRFCYTTKHLLQVMTELSSYSLQVGPSGNMIVYNEPQAPLSTDEIESIQQYLSILHFHSGHSQISSIINQLLIVSTALGI